MAIELQQPWKDTPVSGASAATLTLPVLNFESDWAVQTNDGKEAFLTNTTAPRGLPQRFKFAVTDVANVFTGTGIDPTLWTLSRRGVSVVCQLNSVYDLVDPEKPEFKQQVPISCHVVLKVPNCDLLTSDVVKEYLCRTLAGLFETGSDGSERISRLLRGALLPQNM